MYNPDAGVPAYYQSVPGNVWQQSGSWVGNGSDELYGPGQGAIVSGAAGDTAFNYIIGSQLGIWYYDSGSGFDVAINGQHVGSVSINGSGIPQHAVFDCPAASNEVYSWTITAQGQGTAICGVEGLSPNGCRIDNFSFPGLASRAVANLDSVEGGTYCGGWRNPADLIIYELAGLDIIGGDSAYPDGTPPDTWLANVQGYFDGVLDIAYGGTPTGQTDIIFVFPMAFNGFDKFRLGAAYRSRALGLAQMYGAALFDMSPIFHNSWNSWQQAGYAGNQNDPAKSGQDFNHPSDEGSQVLAGELARLLVSLT